MTLTVVVGTQYGDEGKGRIIDNLVVDRNAFAAVRAQGGDNAGHTIVEGDNVYKLHLIPASIIGQKEAYIAKGVVVNPFTLEREASLLDSEALDRLTIDDEAHVIGPWHVDLDKIRNERQGNYSAGSTRRGIAPVYSDKAGRYGLRICDLLNDDARVDQVVRKSAEIVAFEKCIAGNEEATLTAYLRERNELLAQYKVCAGRMRESMAKFRGSLGDVASLVENHLNFGVSILAEMAQGSMISVNSPYYPRGTSSDCDATGAWAGIGIGPRPHWMQGVVGVAKAYVTRVGRGPFVTEMPKEDANRIRKIGKEYGTTTKRPRRVGWFDVPMIRHAHRANGLTKLALTKIDVLGGLDSVKICTSYNKGQTDEIPPLGYEEFTPNYEVLPGWPKFSEEEYREQLENGIDGVRNENLRRFLRTVEELTLPIAMVTYGEDRNACSYTTNLR